MKRVLWGMALLVLTMSGCASQNNPPSANELLIIPNETETVSVNAPPAWTEPTTSASADPGSPGAPGEPTGDAAPGPVDTSKAPKVGSVMKNVLRSMTSSAAVVVDRINDQTLLSENGDGYFISGSLVKILIGVDAMRNHPHDATVARRVYTMIQFSDDNLASAFWGSENGSSIIVRMRSLMGLKSTKPPNPAGMWGWTMLTANDMIRAYDYLMDSAPEEIRENILDAMAHSAPAGSDGFTQRFGIPDGLGGQFSWAVKQAWASNNSTDALHTSGFVGDKWRYEVVVLTQEPLGTNFNVTKSAVTAGCKAISSFLKT